MREELYQLSAELKRAVPFFHPRHLGHMSSDMLLPGLWLYTSLQKESLPGREVHRILEELGVDPETFVLVPEDDVREADHIFLFRHTLMNPWLLAGPDESNYIDRYWEYLEQVVADVLGEPDDWQFPSGGS